MKIEQFPTIGHLNAFLKSAECVAGRFRGVRIRCISSSGRVIWTTRNALTKIAAKLIFQPTVIEFRYTACAETIESLKRIHAFRVDGRALFTRIRQFFGNFRFKREAEIRALESKLHSFERELDAFIEDPKPQMGGAGYLKVVNGFLSRNLPEKALQAASLIPKEGYLKIALAAYLEIARYYQMASREEDAKKVLHLLETLV